jgi:hypothetical protein
MYYPSPREPKQFCVSSVPASPVAASDKVKHAGLKWMTGLNCSFVPSREAKSGRVRKIRGWRGPFNLGSKKQTSQVSERTSDEECNLIAGWQL